MIYLVRHGLDDERYIGGWSDVDLIEKGKIEVEEIAKFIKQSNLNIDKIYSSDIKRARTTTEIINKYLNLEVETSSIYRELDKGDLTGNLKDNYDLTEYNNNLYLKYPNGESYKDFYERIKKLYYEEIINLDNVLIVTHRGVINMIYTIINDDPLSLDKEKYDVTHASLHELDKVKKKIKKIGDCYGNSK